LGRDDEMLKQQNYHATIQFFTIFANTVRKVSIIKYGNSGKKNKAERGSSFFHYQGFMAIGD
jgi:hypothetical protein